VDNLFGISNHAKDDFDHLDRPEPPRMGSDPYITFPHPEWDRSVTEYASDIRHSWNKKPGIFQVCISPCDKNIISLTLNIKGKLSIHDARGRVVRELINRKQLPGKYKIMWKGAGETGHRVASGTYICRLEAGKYSSVKKIIFIR
jgi:hypothetical protein